MSFSKAWDKAKPVKANELKKPAKAKEDKKMNSDTESTFGFGNDDKSKEVKK